MFDKYEAAGAYHWRECDPSSPAFNPPLVARYNLILSRARGGRALDVGAGDGYLTARLAEHCDKVIGVEYEDAGIAAAQEMLRGSPNASVVKGSAYDLQFPDASFDLVAMADVIEHLDSPELAVSEMARVAADDAIVLITTPHWRSDRTWDPRHVKEYTAAEFSALVGVGFREVELVFAWPRFWSDLYRTRLGWRGLRWAGRAGFNPFMSEGESADGFCQMLAVARKPIRHG